MTVHNPWPGQQAEIVSGVTGHVVVAPTTATTLRFDAVTGRSYLVKQPATSYPFAEVTGTPAIAAKHLGHQQIGLDAPVHYASLAASFNDVAITDDTSTAPGNLDGGGASFSAQALAAAGAAPGATITSSGMSFTFPAAVSGTNDNTVADGQWVAMSGSGSTLGFLISGSYSPVTGTGEIIYADGSTQAYTVTSPDWFSTTAPAGGAVAVNSAYQNRQGPGISTPPSPARRRSRASQGSPGTYKYYASVVFASSGVRFCALDVPVRAFCAAQLVRKERLCIVTRGIRCPDCEFLCRWGGRRVGDGGRGVPVMPGLSRRFR